MLLAVVAIIAIAMGAPAPPALGGGESKSPANAAPTRSVTAAPAGPVAPDTAPIVAVSIPPQKWLVTKLAGDLVRVVVVVDSGANHETYQPTDRQASDVLRASAYFAIGLPLERGRWFEAVRGRVRVVDCTVGVEPRTLEGHHHGHGQDAGHDHACAVDGRDPHIWTSPAALKVQARTMAAALAEILPANRAAIRERLAALEGELESLDASLRATLAPCRGKAMVVFHPAWGYFADAYGLRQVAIEQDGKTPSDHGLTQVQRTARAENATVVFVQPQIAGKAADAVAAAIGGRVERIDPLVEDVPANLRKVAETIAKTCRAAGGGGRP